MMLPSHLLGTLLVGLLASRVRPLRPREWLLALGFGVAIDLDHALQFPAYLFAHGLDGLSVTEMLQWGGAWQGFMHTPWALLVVAPFCLLYRSWVPAAFWGLHMVQDFVIARHYVVFGSATEWVIDAALLAIVGSLFLQDHRTHGRGARFDLHVAERLGLRKAADAAPDTADAA